MQKRTLAPKLVAGALIVSLSMSAVPSFPGMEAASAVTVYAAEDAFVFDAATGCITAYKGSDQTVNIPQTINGVRVTGIGWGAFRNCTVLTKVTFPSTLKTIGSMAFEGCTGLTAVEIPSGVTVIAPYTFYGCTKLSSVGLPSNVTSIMLEAFGKCPLLKEVILPDHVTTLEDEAFAGCSSLNKITIPASTVNFGKDIFFGCAQGLTIVANKGSAAESYAVSAGLTFQENKPGGSTGESETNSGGNIGESETNSGGNIGESETNSGGSTDESETNSGGSTDESETNLGDNSQSEDQKAANAVIDMIANLGTITLDSEKAINDALNAYNSLTEAQKALVTNLNVLTKAQETLTVLKNGNIDDDNGFVKFALNQRKATLYTKGKCTLTLKANNNGLILAGTDVTWKSSNTMIAAVDKNGKVTAKKRGKVTITATYKDASATVTITVKKPSLKLKKKKITLKMKKKYTIKATAKPAKRIAYKTRNRKVAVVSKKGIVTAKGIGKTKIIVKANGVTKQFTVTVKK